MAKPNKISIKKKIIFIFAIFVIIASLAILLNQGIKADVIGTVSNQATLNYVQNGVQKTIQSNLVQININGDLTPPVGTLKINNGATTTYTNFVSLNLEASDMGGSGLSQMQFSNNNIAWSPWFSYSTAYNNWDLNNATYGGNSNYGQKTVYVRFQDSASNISMAANNTIDYQSSTNDSINPNVTITSPRNGSRIRRGSNTNIKVTANDNIGVVKVEFYLNDKLISSDNSSPYSSIFTLPMSDPKYTSYKIQAKAYDAAGNTSISNTITISSR